MVFDRLLAHRDSQRTNRPAKPKVGMLVVLFLALSFGACTTIPVPLEEYTLARAAMESAQAVDAATHSPGFWSRGEESYRDAQMFLKEKRNEDALAEFKKARVAFEKAENAARLIRFKTGEVL
ncbi:MAG: hypothetical protein AB7O96_15625 [Pseudobdellovibrionaceae bacterium]